MKCTKRIKMNIIKHWLKKISIVLMIVLAFINEKLNKHDINKRAVLYTLLTAFIITSVVIIGFTFPIFLFKFIVGVLVLAMITWALYLMYSLFNGT